MESEQGEDNEDDEEEAEGRETWSSGPSRLEDAKWLHVMPLSVCESSYEVEARGRVGERGRSLPRISSVLKL